MLDNRYYLILLQHSLPCQGLNTNLTANFNGFNTTLYKRRGCGSSTCEGVEILKSLHVSQSFLDSNVHSHLDTLSSRRPLRLEDIIC